MFLHQHTHFHKLARGSNTHIYYSNVVCVDIKLIYPHESSTRIFLYLFLSGLYIIFLTFFFFAGLKFLYILKIMSKYILREHFIYLFNVLHILVLFYSGNIFVKSTFSKILIFFWFFTVSKIVGACKY